jgi:hypothetical protein
MFAEARRRIGFDPNLPHMVEDVARFYRSGVLFRKGYLHFLSRERNGSKRKAVIWNAQAGYNKKRTTTKNTKGFISFPCVFLRVLRGKFLFTGVFQRTV